MKLPEVLRHRHPAEPEEGPAPTGAPPPIAGYDALSAPVLCTRLHDLPQTHLAAVEDYEREHLNRPAVLDKLRYLRTSEPLPGYDALTPVQIAAALADADATTVKAVRDYERKFRDRHEVLAETARVLPTATDSAGADRARKQREARVRAGFASREQTARDLRDGQDATPPQ
jgi:hypothetical protein